MKPFEIDPRGRGAKRILNGKYTMLSPSGEHRTFDISTQDEKARFAPGKRIVSMLVGPSNLTDYRGFAFIDETGVKVWRSAGEQSENGPGFFERVAEILWSILTLGEKSRWHGKGVRIMVEARCVKCNRTLTTPESVERGIGPTCEGRED